MEAKLKYWTNIRSETLDLKNGNSGAASEGVASTRMGFVMAAAVVAAFKRWAMP